MTSPSDAAQRPEDGGATRNTMARRLLPALILGFLLGLVLERAAVARGLRGPASMLRVATFRYSNGIVSTRPSPDRGHGFSGAPLHGEWAPETWPDQFTHDELYPRPHPGPPPGTLGRAPFISYGASMLDNSHPEYTTERYPATRSGLEAALAERQAQVDACVQESDMRVDDTVTYEAVIWADIPMAEGRLRAVRMPWTRFTEDEEQRMQRFTSCLNWALTSAEFQRTEFDEVVNIWLSLPAPRSTAEHRARAAGAEAEAKRWGPM